MEDTQEVHTVGIVGLGLIGGSFAKAYHAAGWRVLAFDIDADTMAVASIDETIQATLGPDNVGEYCLAQRERRARAQGLPGH